MLTRYCFCCVLALANAVCLMAQPISLRALDWGAALGNNFSQRLKSAADGGSWLLMAPNNYAGPELPSRLVKLNTDGLPGATRQIRTISGPGAVLYDFAETPDGAKYALILTDESPFPTVIVGGQLHVAKFDAGWNLTWVYALQDPSGSGIVPRFAQINVATDGWVYAHFITNQYQVVCFAPNGVLVWSKAVFTGAQGTGLVRISGGIHLSPNAPEVYFYTYFEPGDYTRLLRIDRFTGEILAGTDIQGVLVHALYPALDGGIWALGQQPEAQPPELLVLKLDPQLAPQSALQFSEQQARSGGQLLWASDSTFVVAIDGFEKSIFLHADLSGNLIRGVAYQGIAGILPINTEPIRDAGNNGLFRLAASPRPGVPQKTLLLTMDADLALPNCTGAPWCNPLRPAVVTTVPAGAGPGIAQPWPTGYLFEWDISPAIQVADFCTDLPEVTGVRAVFSLPDTLCAGASVSPSGLQNGGASSASWSFDGGIPVASTALNPTVRFDIPGTFVVRQVVGSACLQDTFARIVTVVAQPLVALPPAQVFCRDTSILVTPVLTNADAWAWSDGWPSLTRTISNSGTYQLQATNQGFCATSQALTVEFIPLDPTFDLPERVCQSDRPILSVSPQPPGTSWTWTANPPLPGFPSTSAVLLPEWPSDEEYAITLMLTNQTCMAAQTAVVEVLVAPTVSVGPDIRLQQGGRQVLRPVVTPATAVFSWSDGWPNLNRVVTDTGLYVLQVEVGDCRAVDSVRVRGELQIYQPNIFMPGSGTANAYFRLYPGTDAEVERLDIFDRWGSLVFSGTNNAAWDGNIHGRPAATGIYTYTARLRLAEETVALRSGDLMLLR